MADRSSTWAFIVYPESAPTDWKKLLKLSFVACAISPLHHPDNNGSNEERKEHHHILLNYDSLKSLEQVKSITITLNATNPVIVQNPSGYYKYMVHACSPDKEQFPLGFNAIEKYNGFDADKFEQFTKKQIRAFKKDIIKIINKNNITEYESLVNFFNDNYDAENFDIYFDLVTTNTIFFNSFLCSKRNRFKNDDVENINKKLSKLEDRINKWKKNS